MDSLIIEIMHKEVGSHMNLFPWNPLRDIDSIGREMNNFLENLKIASPRIDVYQTETEVIINAEIPGVSKEDLNVYVDEDTVRLSGETKRDEEYKDENIYRTERFYGNFSRTISLPVEVKSEQAKAEYKNGILSIRLPKVEPTKIKGRRINID